jgi:haloacid dehalogenase-like hydrolase
VKVLMGGILQAFAGMTVDDYGADAHSFVHEGQHPTLGRSFRDCGYRPMIELLEYLEANGFTCYIASGGDRDFMRPVTQAIYNIPSERVIGSSNGLRYEPDEHGGKVVYLAEPDYFDDGPVKPVRIWSRVGRRPILAAGNSNGDIEMLRFAGGPARPGLRLLVLHDDPEREFDYTAGAERSLEEAKAHGWTVVSIKRDWTTVFDPTNSLNRPGIRLCWRIQVAGRGWASRASREVQLPVVATPVSQASTRTRLMASAVSTCCRWVLARPR